MSKTKKIVVVSVGILLWILAVWAIYFFFHSLATTSQQNTAVALHVNSKTIHLVIADTENLRVQGLSGRENLPPDTAILFDFQKPGQWGIWMKDMKFSLDILWLDSAHKVVTIKENISPNTYPEAFTSTVPASYVLEAPAGFAAENHIDTGETLDIH